MRSAYRGTCQGRKSDIADYLELHAVSDSNDLIFTDTNNIYNFAAVKLGFVGVAGRTFEPFGNITLAEANNIFDRTAEILNIDNFDDISEFSGEYMTRERAYYCIYQLYNKYKGGADYAALTVDEIVQIPPAPETTALADPTATPIQKDNKTPLIATLAVTAISAAVFLFRIFKDKKTT